MRRKNPAAVTLATRRSSRPKARPKLSARRRSDIARHAARARWARSRIGTTPSNIQAIWDMAAELTRDIPAEEWNNLPADLTDHLDHYIYGTPKR